MRAVVMVLLLVLAGSVRLLCQNSVVSGRPPAVFWKRGMVVPPRRATPAAPRATTGQSPVRAGQDESAADPISAAVPDRSPPRLTREQMMKALAEVPAGASRRQVIDKLGLPAYSIGIPEGGHYVERCRFRSGVENVATIEFRDGVMATIDRSPH